MEVIYITIGASVLVAVLFLIAFIRTVRSGQYDDTYTPSIRMLFDDELIKDKQTKQQATNNKQNKLTINN